ncbi:ArpU family phage packaging/lysis transcriptional regulator [Melghirimyces algeriensis]|uniref:Phage transcriptional regulator, ArpU family n=1 Tax=Melghirimyces algeriensis TaxID=910412 RepID=A0A521C5F7_9BACL|nr:ArpU family phage packaging/lysis transcriptional regulator [Melghirimyces algeriensis]SMO54648.1 phage transcriptional regulator, ArpU family [Melghirimyces algeriensis]
MGTALKEKTKYKKPTYRKEVERVLKEYPILKVAVETEQEAEKVYPSCTLSYEERVNGGYSEYQSSTEKFGIRRANKCLKVKRIEKALTVLDLDERFIIDERYLKLNWVTDIQVYTQLGWSERNYYRIKERALWKLAVALNIL